MTNIPYILNTSAITVVVDGTPYTFLSTGKDASGYTSIKTAIQSDMDEQTLKALVKREDALRQQLAANTTHGGRITFEHNTLRVDGQPVHSETLVNKLREFVNNGVPLGPWLALLERVWANPAEYAREEFLLWFEAANMPITPEGHVIAYKRVRSTYMDIHSNTILYALGTTVEMDRSKIDPNRHQTCSAGLHFCSRSYLPSFSSHGGDDRILLVDIDPADVVSIPSDYNNAKGRAWRMKVVGEVPLDSVESLKWEAVYNADDNDSGEEDDNEQPAPMPPAPIRPGQPDTLTLEQLHGPESYVVTDYDDWDYVDDADYVVRERDGSGIRIVETGRILKVGDETANGYKLLLVDDGRGYALWTYRNLAAEHQYVIGCRNFDYERALHHWTVWQPRTTERDLILTTIKAHEAACTKTPADFPDGRNLTMETIRHGSNQILSDDSYTRDRPKAFPIVRVDSDTLKIQATGRLLKVGDETGGGYKLLLVDDGRGYAVWAERFAHAGEIRWRYHAGCHSFTRNQAAAHWGGCPPRDCGYRIYGAIVTHQISLPPAERG